ncbi:MAG: hypothetical protein ACI4V7_09275 [Succinivibrionaceae bacterium]
MSKFKTIVENALYEVGALPFPKNIQVYAKKEKVNLFEIKYLRKDGKLDEPGGICYAKTGIWKDIRKNENAFIRARLDEKFRQDQGNFSKYRGGMIVFALSVNTVIDKMNYNQLVAEIKKIWYTLINKTFKNKMIKGVVNSMKNTYANIEDAEIGGITIGNNFKGVYFDGNKVYNDKSTSLEINDISSEMLLLLAIEICKAFRQDSVLIKDFNKNKFFLCDSEEVEGEIPEEKIKNASKDLANLKNVNTKTK